MSINPHQAAFYRIEVAELLDGRGGNWFDEMTVVVEMSTSGVPTTVLSGLIADQAALRGLLTKIWNMNLTVMSVSRTEFFERSE